jgi:hypothetical protein
VNLFQAIFKETQRPTKEMQQTISDHLGLDISTVQNYFMNTRRRYRDRIDRGWDQPKPNKESKPRRKSAAPPSAAPAAFSLNNAGSGRPMRQNWDTIDEIVNAVAAGLLPPQYENLTMATFPDSGSMLPSDFDMEFGTTPVGLDLFSTAGADVDFGMTPVELEWLSTAVADVDFGMTPVGLDFFSTAVSDDLCTSLFDMEDFL